MSGTRELTIEKRVKKEYARLKRNYKELPPDTLKVVDGLLIQAARLRVSLDDAWEDIQTNGAYELFSQSEKMEPYERERPITRIYTQREQNYQKIIHQLTDLIRNENKDDPSEGL